MRFFIIILFLSIINIANGFEIYSVTPEEIYPNTTITIRGNFDIENLTILFAKEELKYNVIDKEHITLTIPQNLEPAIYFINFLNNKNGQFIAGIPIRVNKPKTKIFEYEPKFLDYCGENKNIEIRGENLNFIKHIFINGQEMENFEKSYGYIKINIPNNLPLSIKQDYISITLHNESRNLVELLNIPINTKPDIETAFISNNFFNYYEITIKGKNFISGSKLFVNNIEINERFSKLYDGIYFFGQQYITKPQSTTLLHDTFYIEDCNTIILTRYPVTSDDKNLKIQIESPSGSRSSEYILTAP